MLENSWRNNERRPNKPDVCTNGTWIHTNITEKQNEQPHAAPGVTVSNCAGPRAVTGSCRGAGDGVYRWGITDFWFKSKLENYHNDINSSNYKTCL
jgi:hypothetical protein